VQRFVLQENAKRFRERLAEATDAAERLQLLAMLATVEREFAILEAAEAGAGAPPWPIGSAEDLAELRAAHLADFQREFGVSSQVAYLIDPAPGLAIVEINHAFELATGLAREQVAGQPLFLLFPDNPEDAEASGVANLYASLRRVAESGLPHAMPVQRYDVRRPDGAFEERHWRPVNAPLHDDNGRLIFLLHVVDEVTEQVRDSQKTVSAAAGG
jgi:PAS domain S-box-containing protein